MRTSLHVRFTILFLVVATIFEWHDLVKIYNDLARRQESVEIFLLAPTTLSSTRSRSSRRGVSSHDRINQEQGEGEEITDAPSPEVVVAAGAGAVTTDEDDGDTTTTTEDNNKETSEDDVEPSAPAADNKNHHQPDDTKNHHSGGIPHRLIFTYKWNLLERQEPRHFYDNVLHTIRAYQAVWGVNDCTIVFLDDESCRTVIDATAPILRPYFDNEPKGSFRSDICRVVELYARGGYYFDIDMELIDQPFIMEDAADDSQQASTFGTAVEAGAGHFFQSFLISAPGNPILKLAFAKIRQFYDDRSPRQYMHMGPYTLKAAYDELHGETNATLLQEVNLEDHSALSYYPNLQRRKGRGCCCNYVLLYHNVPYFYSRMVGAGFHCDYP
jgi:Glycosyltransferase sugar-binding region containing DXD motif